MPITINGNGAISGLGDIDGHDLETATLVVSGDTTIAPQAVGRATLFVDDSTNSVGINTTTPAASVLLEVADGTDPIVSLNNTGNGEVRLGCTAAGGYIGTESNHPFDIEVNSSTAISVLTNGYVGIGQTNPVTPLQIGPTPTGSNLASGGGALTLSRNGDTFLQFWNSGSNQGHNLLFNNGGVEAGKIEFISNSFRTFINGNRRTALTNSGLWIGTGSSPTFSSPSVPLHVAPEGTAGANNVVAKFQTQQNNNNTSTEIQLINSGAGTSIHGFGFRQTRTGPTNTQFNIFQYDGGPSMVGVMGIEADGRIVLNSRCPGIAFEGNDISSVDVTSKTLNDYEEGSWLPVPVATSNSSTMALPSNLTYPANNCKYVKVGNFVWCSFAINFTTQSLDINEWWRFTGLPFTMAADQNNFQGIANGQSVNDCIGTINSNFSSGFYFSLFQKNGSVTFSTVRGTFCYKTV